MVAGVPPRGLFIRPHTATLEAVGVVILGLNPGQADEAEKRVLREQDVMEVSPGPEGYSPCDVFACQSNGALTDAEDGGSKKCVILAATLKTWRVDHEPDAER